MEIVQDWQAFGLKATNSHSIVVHNQFVPDERTFSLQEQLSFLEEPLYSYPFLPFAQATFAAISIGIARHLLDEVKLLVHRQQDAWDSAHPGRSDFIRNRIGHAEDQLNTRAELFYQIIARSWKDHLERKSFTPDELAEISSICQETSRTALACGQQLFPYLGISVIMEHEPINQIWRDLQTVCQHSLLVPFG